MKRYPILFVFCLGVLVINCYSLEKQYNYGNPYLPSPEFTEDDPQFEEGEPVWILDKTGDWIFRFPLKLFYGTERQTTIISRKKRKNI